MFFLDICIQQTLSSICCSFAHREPLAVAFRMRLTYISKCPEPNVSGPRRTYRLYHSLIMREVGKEAKHEIAWCKFVRANMFARGMPLGSFRQVISSTQIQISPHLAPRWIELPGFGDSLCCHGNSGEVL